MKSVYDCKITFEKFDPLRYADNSIVTDALLSELYGINGDNVYILPRGERAKSLDNVARLCHWFAERQLSPQERVVAVGGGSIGDTVGFACSIYKRGIDLLHVPTTLLAMADSAVGGKTGVDCDGVKNLLGTYWFADALVDFRFLDTLDDIQMQSGMGEVLKYRLLNERVQRLYEQNTPLEKLIEECILFKTSLCREDPFCQNKRNSLNCGHTVGHAMELALGIPHGVAVANGIYYEVLLANKLGYCTNKYADFWREEVKKQFCVYPLMQEMLRLTLQDKKNGDGLVGFSLPPDFSSVKLPFDVVLDILL